jgi:hypothetical protein
VPSRWTRVRAAKPRVRDVCHPSPFFLFLPCRRARLQFASLSSLSSSIAHVSVLAFLFPSLCFFCALMTTIFTLSERGPLQGFVAMKDFYNGS